MKNYKNIHIGKMIRMRVEEKEMETERICNFMKCTEQEITETYELKTIDGESMLRWSKLLEYDFFRIYSQHLILYAPLSSIQNNKNRNPEKSVLPQFRKNIYTTDIINFILEEIEQGEKTKKEVIEQYGIPKTTLYKWISKHKQ